MVGHVEGKVLGSDSAGVRDVAVVASSPSLLGVRRTATDESGRFRLVSLPVGTYRVRVIRPGFRPVAVESVTVNLGSTTQLPSVLVQPVGTAALEEVVVRAAETVAYSTATSRVTMDSRQLDKLPVERNFRGLALLAPLATPSFFPGDETNVGGATGPENVYFVDGINVTSPIDGATSIDLPYNFFRQVEVRSGDGTSDVAQALGGVMNLVTPSGGNRVFGDVFAFYTGHELQGTPAKGRVASADRFQYDVGASLGGPLIRDRLWAFGAYNPVSERRRYTFAGPVGALDHDTRQHLMAFKLTGLPGARTLASLTFLADPTDESTVGPAIPIFGDPAGVAEAGAVEGRLRRRGENLSLKVEHQATSQLRFDASVARSSRHEIVAPREGVAPAPTVIDYVTGDWSGGFGYTSDAEGERRSARLSATYSSGAHTVRAGTEYDWQQVRTTTRGSAATAGGFLRRVDVSTYEWFQFNTNGRLANLNPALFVRDTWQATPSLVIDAGLRWSTQRLVRDGELRHSVADGLQPQVSMEYRLGDSGRQRVRASYTRVADQLALWSLAQFHGPNEYRVVVYPRNPLVDSSGGFCAYCTSLSLDRDRHMDGVRQDEASAGYETRLDNGVVVSVRGARRRLFSVIEDGVSGESFAIGNPGRGSLDVFPRAWRNHRSLTVSLSRWDSRSPRFIASYVRSRTRGNYTGLYASDLAAGTPHVSGQFDFPEQLVNGSGLLPNDRTHVVKIIGSHDLRRDFSIGASLLAASGTPLSEYGAIPQGAVPGFASPRGSAGRLPAIWDLGLRIVHTLPGSGTQKNLILDVQHIGNRREVVGQDQLHFTVLDDQGNQSGENALYGQPTRFQQPMTARLGVQVRF